MITTVTLNASIDKAYYMDKAIEGGTVMRVARTRNSAGGKGLNVARVVKLCGEDVKATGLVGGFNGQYLEAMVKEDGLTADFVHIAGETRSCINILDSKFKSTEFLEAGCTVTPEEEADFLQKLPDIVKDSAVVTLSGSAPQGLQKDIYARIVEVLKGLGKQVILDTSGELLEKGLAAKPTLVKPNKDEMEALFGVTINGFEDVIENAKKIYAMGIPYVVVSLGGDGALLVCAEGIFKGTSPDIEVVNTVGCGDSMVGAFAVALSRNYEPKEALKYAVAVGSANAMSPNTGDFEQAVFEELYRGTTVTTL